MKSLVARSKLALRLQISKFYKLVFVRGSAPDPVVEPTEHSIYLWLGGLVGSAPSMGRYMLWVRFMAVSDIYPMLIEPTITWAPLGFSRHIWLDTKMGLTFKKEGGKKDRGMNVETCDSTCPWLKRGEMGFSSTMCSSECRIAYLFNFHSLRKDTIKIVHINNLEMYNLFDHVWFVCYFDHCSLQIDQKTFQIIGNLRSVLKKIAQSCSVTGRREVTLKNEVL